MKRIFVTGIGTGVGKTVVSAILAEALKADYWKPVQAGALNNTDTMKVRNLVTNGLSRFHPESYLLSWFMAPHTAASIDVVEIGFKKIKVPETENTLIIEGAGGLLVPLNGKSCVIDLIRFLDVGAILVSQNYLGSINHTLLSAEALKSRGIKTYGLIFNGEPNNAAEDTILSRTGLKCLGRVDLEEEITKKVVFKYALKFAEVELNEN